MRFNLKIILYLNFFLFLAEINCNKLGNDLSEFVISPTEIASFTYGKRQCRIWESVSNGPGQSPSKWQFRYDPIFVPSTHENNTVIVNTKKRTSQEWRTSFTINLDNERARMLAYQKIIEVYPNESHLIKKSNIFSFPVRSIKVDLNDLLESLPNVEIVKVIECNTGSKSSACYSFDAATKIFRISIKSSKEDTALDVEHIINDLFIGYEIQVSGIRQMKTNRIQVSFGQLKKSQLYTKLVGEGKKQYISRNDLRNALKNVKEEIKIIGTIESPDKFDESLLQMLVERWTQISTDKFDEISWKSTYNADDLKPDVITKDLNEVFKYDESTKKYHINTAASAKAKASVFGFINVGVDLSGSYTKDELEHMLKKNYVKTEITGNVIVAKSIDLIQINWADFDDDKSFLSVLSYVSEPNAIIPIKSFIDLSDFTTASSTTKKKLQAFINDRNPIGMLINYYGTMTEAEEKTEHGYWICDGRKINDVQSPMNGENTPDLRNLFIEPKKQSVTTDKCKSAINGKDFKETLLVYLMSHCSNQAFPNLNYSVIYLIKVRDSYATITK